MAETSEEALNEHWECIGGDDYYSSKEEVPIDEVSPNESGRTRIIQRGGGVMTEGKVTLPERTIRVTLKDGSIVTMNTEERVISYQLASQMIPLITDADSVFDDVLEALEEAQQTIARLTADVKLKDNAVEHWISLAGRLADACGYCAEEHHDDAAMAEDALSYYLPEIGEYDGRKSLKREKTVPCSLSYEGKLPKRPRLGEGAEL